MSITTWWGIYNKNNELLNSFDSYDEAKKYLKNLKKRIGKKQKIQYLFHDKPSHILITEIVYICYGWEMGGGFNFDKKYYFNLNKI